MIKIFQINEKIKNGTKTRNIKHEKPKTKQSFLAADLSFLIAKIN
jgi:hypothetical protein